jgi:hypothetical protein
MLLSQSGRNASVGGDPDLVLLACGVCTRGSMQRHEGKDLGKDEAATTHLQLSLFGSCAVDLDGLLQQLAQACLVVSWQWLLLLLLPAVKFSQTNKLDGVWCNGHAALSDDRSQTLVLAWPRLMTADIARIVT